MTTRSLKNSSKEQDKYKPQSLKKRVENSWILLAKGSLIDDNEHFSIVTLPQPGSGLPSKYCLDKANKKIYEIVVYDEPHRSWFIGETVKSDGKIHITTLVNPTFLLLPRLIEECSTRAVPLEDLLSHKGFDQILDYVPSLDHVADLKGSSHMKAYKYNEKKTLGWLETRVRNVAKALRNKNIHVASGAVSATFVVSSKHDDPVDEEFHLKYAHGLVSQYLPEHLADTLEKHFDFKPDLVECLSKKRKSEADKSTGKRKIMKIEHIDELKENQMKCPNQDSGNTTVKAMKPVTLTTKEKARQKAASGSKSISSFFTKK